MVLKQKDHGAQLKPGQFWNPEKSLWEATSDDESLVAMETLVYWLSQDHQGEL